MDNTETHYLTYDADAIYREMQEVYLENGGDVLYPGDEKEMLLRACMGIMIHGFAAVDNALRMATLRYAVGQYLDLYGENRNCYRIEAQSARATAEIHIGAAGQTGIISAGTNLTADGERIYKTETDVTISGYEQTVRVSIIAAEPGTAGNGLQAGTQMQFLNSQTGVESVYCVVSASGGQQTETDEAYRERIRAFGLANNTTGPENQYITATRAVSSEIIDVKPVTESAGTVGIGLLLTQDADSDSIIQSVYNALNNINERPLTDNLHVYTAQEIEYTLKVQYLADEGTDISAEVASAVAEYENWQDNTIGRAFNPDKLLADIYSIGARRVIWGAGSNFNGGTVQYTEIENTKRCKGTFTIEVMQDD